MTLRRLIGLVVLVLVNGCGPAAPAPTAIGTHGSPAAASPAVAGPAGPITSLLVAADIDAEGNPVDPSFTVPANQAQITVIAAIGKLDGSSRLELVWSRLPDAWGTDDDAEQELFRHSIDVESGDTAWSVGTNPGTLAAGGYIVRATLGDESAEAEFAVAGPASPAEGPVDAASDPVSGESGSSQASSEADVARTCDELWATLRSLRPGTSVDPTAHTVPDDTIPIDLAERLVMECGGLVGFFDFDPCYSADRSDLPGTTIVITWETFGTVRTFDETVVLGDDTLAPRARVRSEPGPGKQVDEGDQIAVTAIAQEGRSGGPWQMGLAQIQLLSLRPSQEVVDSVDFTSQRGKACDAKAWEGTLEATYTVPPNPPPVVELCVVAEDWAGNGQERGEWKCAEFPTGEVWEGTEHGEWRNPAAAGIPGAVIEGDLVSKHDGIIKLTVASDGSVSGEGSGTQVAPAGSATYITKFGGTRKDDAFRPLTMTFSPGGSADFVVPISGRTAELVSKQVVSGQTYTVTIKLTCVSCEEAVG